MNRYAMGAVATGLSIERRFEPLERVTPPC
jgi:hypothetical protein